MTWILGLAWPGLTMAGDATFRERASVMRQLGRGTHIAIIMGLMVLRLNQARTKHHCSAKICRISYNVEQVLL